MLAPLRTRPSTTDFQVSSGISTASSAYFRTYDANKMNSTTLCYANNEFNNVLEIKRRFVDNKNNNLFRVKFVCFCVGCTFFGFKSTIHRFTLCTTIKKNFKKNRRLIDRTLKIKQHKQIVKSPWSTRRT